ncbi:MAG: radical SAM/SPASM domain-containing protein [Phycisphaerae bacterium]
MTKTEIDSHRLIFHPRRVADWLDGKMTYPIYVEVGPTNRCNHRCVFCALDWMRHGGVDFETDLMLKTLSEMGRVGVKSIMFAGEGEPFLHNDIGRFVSHAKENGLDVAITTNGAAMDEEQARACLPHLSWIRVSLDAGSPETYAELHGVNPKEFSKVLQNIETVVRIKREKHFTATIGVQVLILPQNSKELGTIAKRIKEAGADNIQFKPYSHHPLSRNNFSADFNGLEQEVRNFEDESFQVSFRKETIERIESGKNYSECYGLPFFALIDARGNIVPCNMFYNNPDFTYGNLHEQSFAEIMSGERRKQVMKKIQARGIEICRKGCRLEVVNRYLHEIKNPHPHVNFI